MSHASPRERCTLTGQGHPAGAGLADPARHLHLDTGGPLAIIRLFAGPDGQSHFEEDVDYAPH